MNTREVQGTYGSHNTPCVVLVADTPHGSWYCVEGSQNVNFTPYDIADGVDVETLKDTDTFTWPGGIGSLAELESAIDA